MTASTDRASPLGTWSARFAQASAASAQFSIREVAFATQVNLRLDHHFNSNHKLSLVGSRDHVWADV